MTVYAAHNNSGVGAVKRGAGNECMKGLWLITLLLLCSCAAVDGRDAALEYKKWRALEDREVSRLGRAVMRGASGSWIHAETPSFTYHAATQARLERVAGEAEWMYAEVSRRLGLGTANQRGHLFVVEDEADWMRVMRAAGRRSDGIALHVGREIFILRDQHTGSAYIDIPHEMVHYRLWQAYGRDLPLWLEEGLAVHLGWETALAYQETREMKLYRQQSPVKEKDWISWPELFAMTHYPESASRTAAFYRQSGCLLEEVTRVIGAEQIGPFVETLADGRRSLRDVLETDYKWAAGDVDALQARVEQAVKQPAIRAEQ